MKSKRWKQIGLIALSAFIGLVLWQALSRPSLVLRSTDGRELMRLALGETDFFEVSFRHSVNRGLVRERYQIDPKDRSITLVTGWFENYGAGMMDTISEDMEIREEDGFLRIDFSYPPMREVVYRSAGIANHALAIGTERIALFERWPYQAIHISVE